MRRGRFRSLIDLYEPIRGIGATGAPTISGYAPWVVDRWADIVPLSGQETEAAQRLEGRQQYRITIRYLEGLTMAHVGRLRDGTWVRITGLRSVMQREIDHELSCVAIEDGSVGP